MNLRCPLCHSPMVPHSHVSADQHNIQTTWLCSRCLHRESTSAPNPRYQARELAAVGKQMKGASKTETGRFRSQIRVDGQTLYLGTFDTQDQANAAFEEAARKLGR